MQGDRFIGGCAAAGCLGCSRQLWESSLGCAEPPVGAPAPTRELPTWSVASTVARQERAPGWQWQPIIALVGPDKRRQGKRGSFSEISGTPRGDQSSQFICSVLICRVQRGG